MDRSSDEDHQLPLPSLSNEENENAKRSHITSVFQNIFTSKQPKLVQFDSTDTGLILFFLGIGILTRLIRIYYPKQVVFNEEIYGRYLNNYLQGIFFDDINPPLTKLLMSSIIYFAGYRGTFSYKNGDTYSSHFYVMPRLINSFFGSLCIPFSYILMRFIGISHLGSSCAAIMICSDITFIIECRFFNGSGLFYFFLILSTISIYLYEEYESFTFLLFESICLGLVTSSKSQTYGIILLALCRQFPLTGQHSFIHNSGKSIVRCIILLFFVFLVNFIVYFIHISILPFSSTSSFTVNYPNVIKNSLISIETSNKTAAYIKRSKISIFKRVLSLMLHTNKIRLNSVSQNNSSWWTWSICLGKWMKIYEKNNDHYIFSVTNVFVWMPAFLGIIFTCVISCFEKKWFTKKFGMLFGYIVSYIPFVFKPNHFPLNSYLIPLFFAIFNLVVLIDNHCRSKARGFIYLMLIHFSIVGYFFFSPFAYGKHMPDLDFHVWSRRWIRLP